jgi:hypothetical protein
MFLPKSDPEVLCSTAEERHRVCREFFYWGGLVDEDRLLSGAKEEVNYVGGNLIVRHWLVLNFHNVSNDPGSRLGICPAERFG